MLWVCRSVLCPVQDALSAAGIRPSNSKRYPVQDIKDAIEAKYGVMPHVTCDGKGELSEVRGTVLISTWGLKRTCC